MTAALTSLAAHRKGRTVRTDGKPPTSLGGEGAKPGPAKLEQLIRDIEAEQSKVARKEGEIVSNLVRIGALLVDLQTAAGRTWTERVRSLGYHPRAASRLQKIAFRWRDEIGTLGSDFLTRLPGDPQKLEWMCRLSREQLAALLDRMDCKQASRTEVSAAVKELLGQNTTRRRARGIVETVARLFTRMTKALEGWQQTDDGREAPDQLRDVLSGGLGQLRRVLDDLSAETAAEAVHVRETDTSSDDFCQEAPSC
jgi:hypothetical protein